MNENSKPLTAEDIKNMSYDDIMKLAKAMANPRKRCRRDYSYDPHKKVIVDRW